LASDARALDTEVNACGAARSYGDRVLPIRPLDSQERFMTTIAEIPLPRPANLPPMEPYARLLERLSEASVRKVHDPYIDIAWDAPENRIEAGDPRMCLDPNHPLTLSPWYEALSPSTRARFGLEWTAQTLKYGIGFEAVLSRGLLECCQYLPNRSSEYRYAMHELVEEGRHSMMFQEFINRTGTDPRPITGLDAWFDDRVAHWGRTFPERFFISVLAGEIFIDQQNRALLRQPIATVHPLLRRIMQIHVTEEARHVCFAERYLREHLPRLAKIRRARLAWSVPLIFAEAARMMLVPDRRLRSCYGISRRTLRATFGAGSAHRALVAATVEPVRKLCEEHGLFRPHHALMWRGYGLLG
jgi:hypothetical protein